MTVTTSGWKTLPIRDVYLGLFDGPHATPAPSEEGPVFLGIGNITVDGHLDLGSVRRISEEDFPKWTRRVEPKPGDIVFTYEATLNRYAIIPEGFRGCLGRRLALIRPNLEVVDTRFLHFYFFGENWRATIASNTLAGATVERVPLTRFPDFPVTLPSLEEQRRIASILSAYDDLIENNTRRIAILEEMARRIYEEWFVHYRFPGHEAVRMVETELGPVPEGWTETTLGVVAENHDRFRKPLSKMEREAFKGPYPYYGAAKVFDYVRDFLFDGRFLLLAEDGSVETPDGYPVLQLTDGKFWANNHTHILRGSSLASTEFLFLRLERMPIRGYITGAAQPKLTQTNINRIPIVLPPAGLMGAFTDLVMPFFDLRESLLRMNTNLRTTRDLLLPRLISGELDVSDLHLPEDAAA